MKLSQMKLIQITTIILMVMLTLTLGVTQTVYAFENDDDGYIAADEVINDDLFISAEDVTIDGSINGNVFIAAQNAVINGNINGNLLINAASATVNGDVDGSIAMAGQILTVNNNVTGSIYFAGAGLILAPKSHIYRNVFFTGYSFELQEGAKIEVDFSGSGYQSTLFGIVGRNILIDMGALEINSVVGGDVTAKVSAPGQIPDYWWLQEWASAFSDAPIPDTISPGLRISESANIGGGLSYVSSVEQAESIRSEPRGGVNYEESVSVEHIDLQITPQMWLIGRVRELLTILAIGGLLLWKLNDPLQKASANLKSRPLPSLWWGFVIFILGNTLALVLFLTIIFLGVLLAIVTLGGLAGAVFGIGFTSLGLAFAIFILVVFVVTKVVVACQLGSLVLRLVIKNQTENRWLTLVVGVVIYVVLRVIPVVGMFVSTLAMLFGLGAIWLIVWDKKKAKV
ncbi:MAG: polymer-forming cytoskeletal protein [Chloroflexi bacterium]|nr:polymer-forming cytoskeletal protein [Chloroflexota bacterium]MBU1661788.1 polymer-forming cytoskeletal protein [Chloroflexota bacterium]